MHSAVMHAVDIIKLLAWVSNNFIHGHIINMIGYLECVV